VTDGPGASIEWHPAAEHVLETLCRMVPDAVRELAEEAGRAESEAVAVDRGAAAVLPEDVIRGWIRTTPPEQRDSLVEVIADLGFEPERFAEELQSDDAWAEDEER
jgi:hypothetical protein